ncbi:NHL repeat-containing protein [Granulicella mallensis]|uniref:NHL repeat containing protein n=1 Tax=Granulicella mallensis (strain ATCC BAA-1857 / DSM 23137 / MP5ACTX8) TaxID=682795 RepID=G8NPY8_GRAMM|nr:NHL repeat-containing protein [Granulicella mallensis]AEU38322.1 NHL repeat containing protein [Granulicella mallensis MP5ACTX8]
MKNHRLFVSSVASVLGVAFALGLSGCSANFGDVSNAATQTAMHIRGVVHGGQQPISGSHVYMYAASTTAYGGQGIAPTSGNASTSLLTAATGNPADSNGNFYVTTDAFGNFDINGAFACTPNTQVYLYSTGGDPQLAGAGIPGTPNAAASLMAVVGNCASATASSAFPHVTSVFMNEITTQVAAFALAGFATDPLHIGAPSAVTGHSLAGVGLANAFNTALNIVNQATGVPNPTFPNNSNVAVPVERIDTVADFLAACVNSNGPSSSGCSTLFANTNYGTAPTDTAMAAINFAQNPNGNVGALLTLATNASPFQPFFTSANDLSLTLNYTGGGLNFAKGIAIDGAGNAWVTNQGGSSVTEISSSGTFLSGANGFTGGGLNAPIGLAIDGAGNAWVASDSGNSVTEISSSGAFLSGTSGFTGSGLGSPFAIAIDSPGNVWVVNADDGSVTKLSSSGAVLSSYTGGGLDGPIGIAVDGAGNAWVTNDSGNSVTEISSSGAFLSGTNGYFGGGLTAPAEIAIDGTGNAWITNSQATSLSEFSNSGTVLSGTNGYSGGGLNAAIGIAIDGAGNVWAANLLGNTVTKLSGTGTVLSGTGFYTGGGLDEPYAIAIDGSGNVWVSNLIGKSLTEIIGAAAPVITPIVAGLPATPTPDGSSNLGTRP